MDADTGTDAMSLRSVPLDTLWVFYNDEQDALARDELAKRYASLVRGFAASLVEPTGVNERDLLLRGLTALITAIERFDPAAGVTFEDYASERIRHGMIAEYVPTAADPADVAQQARAITEAMRELEHSMGREPTDAEVAAALGHKVHRFRQSLERISDSTTARLEKWWALPPAGNVADEPTSGAVVDDLVHQANVLKNRMADAIAALPEREKLVIALYYYENLSLDEIAKVLGVTRSRIRQLHIKAVLRLRARLGNDPDERHHRARRVPGRLRGKILLAGDFDQTPVEVLDAFEGGP